MQTLSNDEVWQMLHDTHVGMQTIRYRSPVWGDLSKDDYVERNG